MVEVKIVEELWSEIIKQSDEKYKYKEMLIIKQAELENYQRKLDAAEKELKEAKGNVDFYKTINEHLKEDIKEYKRRLGDE